MVAVPLREMEGQLAERLRKHAEEGQGAVFRAGPGCALLSASDLRAMNRGPAAASQEALVSALNFLAGRGS